MTGNIQYITVNHSVPCPMFNSCTGGGSDSFVSVGVLDPSGGSVVGRPPPEMPHPLQTPVACTDCPHHSS